MLVVDLEVLYDGGRLIFIIVRLSRKDQSLCLLALFDLATFRPITATQCKRRSEK
jgi:hypothetical protein